MRRKAFLAGDSHLTCTGVPFLTSDGLPKIGQLDADLFYVTGAAPRDNAFWTTLAENAPGHDIFISWKGNQHLAEHIFASDPTFDFVLSDEPDRELEEDAVIVPEEMIRAKFEPSLRDLDLLLRTTLRVPGTRIFLCGTPPPKEDQDAIRARLAYEIKFYANHFGRDVAVVPLNSPEKMYKMWSVLQTVTRDVAIRNGAGFIPIPPECQTGAGFLKREFWAEDVTHANQAYGRLFLDHIRREAVADASV